MEFLIGGMAGAGAVMFTNPLDVLKTRMQLQGELRARGPAARQRYRGVLHAAALVARTEGPRALQKGLAPAFVYQILLNSTRLGLYQVAENAGMTRNKRGDTSVLASVACASAAGIAGAVVGSPMYLVKTRLQAAAHASIAVGTQHAHRGTADALLGLVRHAGWRGLFAGVEGAVPRIAVGSAVQLSTFTLFKEMLTNRGVFVNSPFLLAFTSSSLSGVFVVFAMSPFDVVSTRLYNQGTDPLGRGLLYNGVVDCISKMYRTEGLGGFYKGWGPLYLRVAPHTMLSLIFWDELKLLNEYYTKQI